MTERSGDAGSIAACELVANAPADRPFVVAQLGQSLDGRIATVTGDSRWINGESALDHLHRLRASVDAVVVGAGTIRADDPQLNVRRCAGVNPARVVIDPSASLPGNGKWLADDGARRIALVGSYAAVTGGTAAASADVEAVRIAAGGDGMSPVAMVDALFRLGLRRILVEGGALTISRFIDAGAVDRLHVLLAPMIVGSGKNSLELRPIEKIAQARRPPATVVPLADGDVLFDCDLRATGR